MGATTGLAKADKAALDMIDALPDRTAKVAARGNLGKGVVAKVVAERLAADGKVRVVTGGRITTDLTAGDKGTGEPEVTTTPVESTPADAAKASDNTEPKAPRVNGRKAKADASPYSTSTPTGWQKRHGKSRRTGTMTQIVDLLAKKGPEEASKAMDTTITLEGSGRFDVECLDHKTHKAVPNMTEAKPLQARTDQFCKQCAKAIATA